MRKSLHGMEIQVPIQLCFPWDMEEMAARGNVLTESTKLAAQLQIIGGRGGRISPKLSINFG